MLRNLLGGHTDLNFCYNSAHGLEPGFSGFGLVPDVRHNSILFFLVQDPPSCGLWLCLSYSPWQSTTTWWLRHRLEGMFMLWGRWPPPPPAAEQEFANPFCSWSDFQFPIQACDSEPLGSAIICKAPLIPPGSQPSGWEITYTKLFSHCCFRGCISLVMETLYPQPITHSHPNPGHQLYFWFHHWTFTLVPNMAFTHHAANAVLHPKQPKGRSDEILFPHFWPGHKFHVRAVLFCGFRSGLQHATYAGNTCTVC